MRKILKKIASNLKGLQKNIDEFNKVKNKNQRSSCIANFLTSFNGYIQTQNEMFENQLKGWVTKINEVNKVLATIDRKINKERKISEEEEKEIKNIIELTEDILDSVLEKMNKEVVKTCGKKLEELKTNVENFKKADSLKPNLVKNTIIGLRTILHYELPELRKQIEEVKKNKSRNEEASLDNSKNEEMENVENDLPECLLKTVYRKTDKRKTDKKNEVENSSFSDNVENIETNDINNINESLEDPQNKTLEKTESQNEEENKELTKRERQLLNFLKTELIPKLKTAKKGSRSKKAIERNATKYFSQLPQSAQKKLLEDLNKEKGNEEIVKMLSENLNKQKTLC